ncbi:MAG: ABC transporter substrate-binding protein [Chloroflexi bacterium]|nr:ABC transporter substrate-binding protein [Chloroflexota bacterium]
MAKRFTRRSLLLVSGHAAIIGLAAACNSQAVPLSTSVPAQPPTAASAAQTPAATSAGAAATAAPTVATSAQSVPDVPREQTLVMSVSDSVNQMTDSEIMNAFLTGAQRTGWHFAFEPLGFYNPYWTQQVSGPSWIPGSQNGEIPYLATRYEYSPDYSGITINLRPGVTWSDGQPFTARDVVFTLNMLRDNAPNLLWSFDMQLWLKEATAADDLTVKLALNNPNPRFMVQFLQWHQDQGFPIVPEHIWKDQDPTTFTNFDLDKGWPITTGPWRLVLSEPTQKIWDRRDDWWGAKTGFHSLPAMKRIVVLPRYEDSKLTQLLIANQVDCVHNLQNPADAEVVMARNPKIAIRTPDKSKPWGWLDWWPNALSFNDMKAPYDDPDIRWAINYAIDRRAIVDVGFQGQSTETLIPLPAYTPMLPFFDAVKDLQQQYPIGTSDPSKTEQIMQSKGYAKDGDGFWSKDGQRFSIVILTPPGFFENFAPIIVAQLRKAGFDASFKAPTNEATLIGTGDADAYINGHLASVRDPYLSMNLYHSQYSAPNGESAPQPMRWKNPEYDKIMDQLGKLPASDPNFSQLYHRAMEIWYKELPDIPTVQWYLILPVNTSYWKGWPDVNNPYSAPAPWHRGAATLLINTLEPA